MKKEEIMINSEFTVLTNEISLLQNWQENSTFV